jgi:hypothetical protein
MTSRPRHRQAANALGVLTLLAAATLPAAALAKDRFEPFVAGAQITELLGPATDAACQPSSTQPGATASGTISGHGFATEVGAFTVASVDCVRAGDPFFTPPYKFNSTAFTLTAANGDQLILAYSGTAELNPVGLLVLNGSFTITGGTGALRHAKGSGTLTGVENILVTPAKGFVTLSGKIAR